MGQETGAGAWPAAPATRPARGQPRARLGFREIHNGVRPGSGLSGLTLGS